MVSFVIMLLIWVCNQALTIYLSFLIVLPLIYTNTLAGFLNVDPEMLEMAETFRLSRWKKFLYIYRPSSGSIFRYSRTFSEVPAGTWSIMMPF